MVNHVTIRIATLDDVVAVQRVARETWRSTYAGQIADVDIDDFLDVAYSERSLSGKVNRIGDGFIVAERDGDIIGYAMAELNRDGEPELYAIYVLLAHHGGGVGRLLWNAATASLARQGHSRMCCWVLASNARACRFYESQGAILTEEREFTVGASLIREARYCVAIRNSPAGS